MLGRSRIALEQLFRRHDHAVDTVAALGRLLFDERALERMRLLERAQAFDGRDLACGHGADRCDAGTHRLAVDQHSAGAALRQAAPEFRTVELKIIAQHIEQRRIRFGRNRTARSVDFEIDGHTWRLQRPLARKPRGAQAVYSALLRGWRRGLYEKRRPAKIERSKTGRIRVAPSS